MATKAVELERLANGTSALARAGPEEWVFVLRAQDILAPLLVHLWSVLADLSPHGPCPKALEAREVARQMSEWQRVNHFRVKWPD